jgi:hypothetical protein
MKVELRLKQLLEEYKIYSYGIEQRMSRETGLHRHTIGKMMRNQMRNPSLEVIGAVCRWLVEQGVPENVLPGALFGSRAPELWKAVGNSQNVLIYLGEYRQWRKEAQPVPERRMISSHDAEVAYWISKYLSQMAADREASAVVGTRPVPFLFSPIKQTTAEAWLKQDQQRAARLFKQMKKRGHRESVILLGSQRVNYLVEYAIADLFDCKPFEETKRKIKIPFYLSYRGFDRDVPSCFGGRNLPPGFKGEEKRGTYYIDSRNKWHIFEWKKTVQDGGILIVVRQGERVEIMVIGFSGRTTSALGKELLEHPEKFWPDDSEKETQENQDGQKKAKTGKGKKSKTKKGEATTLKVNDREIGIYMCRTKFSSISPKTAQYLDRDYKVEEVEIFPLGEKVLNKYITGNSKKKKSKKK